MRTLAVLWRSTHPGPTLVVTAIAAALGVSVGLGPGRLALLTAAVFAGQVSIGLSNDAIDAPRDRAVERTDKPLAREGAPLRTAWVAAVSAALMAVALSAVLGWRMLLVHLVLIGSGWAYNAGLKSTVWSAFCFVLAFGGLPSLATLSLPAPLFAPPWATLAGAAFGVAIHFSNVLPDLDDDRATGVRGLPHRIGATGSAIIAAAALIAGAAVVAFAPGYAVGRGLEVLPVLGFAAVSALAIVALVASLRPGARRLAFMLVQLAALLLATQLIFTGGLTG